MNRFKTPLLAAVFALAGIGNSSASCLISASTSFPVVSQSIKKTGFNIKNYEKVCARLGAANVELVIQGEATVLVGASIAWASVTVRDRATKVHTTKGASASTRIDKGSASIPTAEAMLALAIDAAINTMDIDAAITGVHTARKNLRTTSASYQTVSL